jgi:hypothetical protein
MDELYVAGLRHPNRKASREATTPSEAQIEEVVRTVNEQTMSGKKDVMLLQRWNGKLIAEAFQLSEMEIEIERAVEQVEKAVKSSDGAKAEEKGSAQVTGQTSGIVEEKKGE